MKPLMFSSFLSQLDSDVSDLQYLIRNPSEPYEDWFDEIVAYTDLINDKVIVYPLQTNAFKKAIKNYFDDESDFIISKDLKDYFSQVDRA